MSRDLRRRTYACRRLSDPPVIDGSLRDPAWSGLAWSEEFVDITGREDRRPRFATRLKMGWDDAFLYIGAELEEPHVWGTLRERNAVIFQDNDFEVFLDPDGDRRNYYELEINALGTLWELRLDRPYREGGSATTGCNIPGLRTAVNVRGTLNDPSDQDEGWGVALAIPWTGLARYNPGRPTPPRPGDRWRMNFSRVQWRHRIEAGRYVRVPPHGTPSPGTLDPATAEHPEDNWVWSPQGVIDMHRPERWGEVTFEG